MSMLLMVQAMKIKVGNPTRKLVLIKLADNANDQGQCWPSYQNIADHCEVTTRSVMSHIKALERSGLLRREYRNGEKGNSSNIYHLTLNPSENISPPGENISPPPGENISPRTSHSLEPVNEPKDLMAQSEIKPRKTGYPDEFVWLWANKPEREGANPKKQAYSACKARLKEGSTWREMAEGLKRYFEYCKATGILNTRMVQQMSTFFGTKESFKEKWSVNHAANHQVKNASSSRFEQSQAKLAEWGRQNGVDVVAMGFDDSGVRPEMDSGLRGGSDIDMDSGDWEAI